MASATFVDSSWNGSDAYALEVNVMIESSVNTSKARDGYDAIVKANDQVYNNGYLPATYTSLYETDLEFDCNSSKSKWEQGNDWLNDWGASGPECYLWLHNDCGWAVGEEDGWTERTQAFLGVNKYSDNSRYRAMAVQEAYHSYILIDPVDKYHCDYAARNIESGSYDEHELGKVVPDGWIYKSTPMVASYANNTAKETKGDCSSGDKTPTGGIIDLTSCTMDALCQSRQHHATGH